MCTAAGDIDGSGKLAIPTVPVSALFDSTGDKYLLSARHGDV